MAQGMRLYSLAKKGNLVPLALLGGFRCLLSARHSPYFAELDGCLPAGDTRCRGDYSRSFAACSSIRHRARRGSRRVPVSTVWCGCRQALVKRLAVSRNAALLISYRSKSNTIVPAAFATTLRSSGSGGIPTQASEYDPVRLGGSKSSPPFPPRRPPSVLFRLVHHQFRHRFP